MRKTIKCLFIAIITVISFFGTQLITQNDIVSAATNNKPFMVYYRAWRDKTMHGVNTDIHDANTQNMLDLPNGIDIVNVFSYVPKGQEKKAALFFKTLKSTYAPEIHKRGAKLTRAINYDQLVNDAIVKYGKNPTNKQIDKYAYDVVNNLSSSLGLDGIDIDMETKPCKHRVLLSNKIIRKISNYIGPKANNGSLFVYDTNGNNKKPFKDVKDCFSYLGYQQYGSGTDRTKKMEKVYNSVGFPSDKILAGLTFPEEGDTNNHWIDTNPSHFEKSHMHKLAQYVCDTNIGGMFVYAVDRDGRTYKKHDFKHMAKTTYRWTKTAILESKGYDLNTIKAAAYRNIKKLDLTQSKQKALKDKVSRAKNVFKVISVFMSDNYNKSIDPLFDPFNEISHPSATK